MNGQQEKEEAVNQMRVSAYYHEDDPRIGGPTVGKMEKSLGDVVGCQGMVNEGLKKEHKA